MQDFKSGQYAMVLPKQTAMVSVQGPPGLFLSGLGLLNPIEQGTPRSASVNPVPPESHLSASPTAGQQPFQVASASIALPATSLMPLNSRPSNCVQLYISPRKISGMSDSISTTDGVLSIRLRC